MNTTTRLRTGAAALALLGAVSATTLALPSAAGAASVGNATVTSATVANGVSAYAIAPAAVAVQTVREAASPAGVLKSVRRNCGWVTCSWYMSKKVTRNLKDMIGAGTTLTTGAAYMICSKMGHPVSAAVCAAAILAKGASAAYHITAASNRGGCFVTRVNMAYLFSGVTALQLVKGITFDDVPLRNKYCDAS
ncbi:hypothetical protein Sme01_25000 [Sphaerisporangium melleum]|uniref:Secreted protein n=1 Tax=Sphaerisporangium melleum TaxID=321316 RepID=A0A917QS00_9ACTN|nr:hypothetical protein [Sphaerisporangium melleum]GGK64908.1 hypothetical protein GCM10007964_04930 [Sphaerisporangium melleum]GII70024.1 hypothetical protein Sme01_25000 [Sphaerisporangium melleum]